MSKHKLGTFITLSAAHLTQETRARLDNPDLTTWPCYGGRMPFGYFIYAHDENAGTGDDEIPADLWKCCEYARAKGADYIMFDKELPAESGLDSYEEAPTDAVPGIRAEEERAAAMAQEAFVNVMTAEG